MQAFLPPELIPSDEFIRRLVSLKSMLGAITPGVEPLEEKLIVALRETANNARERIAEAQKAEAEAKTAAQASQDLLCQISAAQKLVERGRSEVAQRESDAALWEKALNSREKAVAALEAERQQVRDMKADFDRRLAAIRAAAA